ASVLCEHAVVIIEIVVVCDIIRPVSLILRGFDADRCRLSHVSCYIDLYGFSSPEVDSSYEPVVASLRHSDIADDLLPLTSVRLALVGVHDLLRRIVVQLKDNVVLRSL